MFADLFPPARLTTGSSGKKHPETFFRAFSHQLKVGKLRVANAPFFLHVCMILAVSKLKCFIFLIFSVFVLKSVEIGVTVGVGFRVGGRVTFLGDSLPDVAVVTPPTASHKPGFGTGAGGSDPGGKVRIFPPGFFPTPFPFSFFPPSFPFLFFPPFPFKAFFAQTSLFVEKFAVFNFGFFRFERQHVYHIILFLCRTHT